MLKKPFIWEVLRKGVHLVGPPFIVIVYTILLNYSTQRIALFTITVFLLILLEFERRRLDFESRFSSMLNALFKHYEKDHVSGSVYVVISCIICFAAFDYWIAIVALFMMCFGDIFSAIFGMLFGKKRLYRRKTVVGTVAGLAANVLVGLVILPNYLFLVLPMAVVASISELFTGKLDDNLTVPLFAGFVGQMIVYFLGYNLSDVTFKFFGS